MAARVRPLFLLCAMTGVLALTGAACWSPGSDDPQGKEAPRLDQRARALAPETSCVAPARLAEEGPSPRCVVSFGRAVGALGIAAAGSPAVISLVHAATSSWTLPAALYQIAFEPLPAESEARVILASAERDAALFAVGADLERYQISTGRVVARLAGPGGMINDLAWTVDGSRLAVAAGGKALVLNADGETVRSLPSEGSAALVAIDARGTHLAVASDVGGVTLVDGLGDAPPRTVTPSLQPASAVAFAGASLWVAGSDGTLRALDAKSGEERARVDVGTPLVKLAIAPDGKHAASAGRDRVIRLHELPSGAVSAQLAWHQAQVVALGWGAGSALLSGDADGELAVWDVPAPR